MKHIQYCVECHRYTLNLRCCNKPTIRRHPPKFSINDQYEAYRREAKKRL